MALYPFIDTIGETGSTGATGTTGSTGSADLPAEALSINGTYIENVIPGYRTLTVSGRETMAQEIKEAEVGRHDGAFFQYRRYPTRDIVVKYQILAGSNSAYREAFIKLNELLDFEEGQLIFADEPDKFFTGTPTDVDLPEPGLNNAVGEFTLHCEDPFKYSTTEKTVNMSSDGNGDYFAVTYSGTHKAYPRLEADFYQTDTEDDSHGDCSYVAFMNEDEKVLQFGDPENNNYNTVPVRIFKRGVSAPAVPSAQIEYNFDSGQIVNTSALNGWSETIPTGDNKLWTTKAIASSTASQAYIASGDWGPVEEYAYQDDEDDFGEVLAKTEINKKWTSQGNLWTSNAGLVFNNWTQTGSIEIVTNSQTNQKRTKVAGYGSGTGWHGPSVTRSISDNIKDWFFDFNYIFAQGSGSQAINQCGQFQAVLWNSSQNKIIAGIQIWKLKGSNKGSIRLDRKSVV